MRHGQGSQSSRTSLKVRNPLRSTSQRPRVMCLPTAALPFCMLLGREPWRWIWFEPEVGISINGGSPKFPKSSILIESFPWFSLINHPFWGQAPNLGNFQKLDSRNLQNDQCSRWPGRFESRKAFQTGPTVCWNDPLKSTIVISYVMSYSYRCKQIEM